MSVEGQTILSVRRRWAIAYRVGAHVCIVQLGVGLPDCIDHSRNRISFYY